MIGDEGPYMDEEGGVWVPRTVPWRRARAVAREAMFFQDRDDDRLVYAGKVDAELVGFARDCQCLERCERRWQEQESGPDVEADRTCVVPAWQFEIVER